VSRPRKRQARQTVRTPKTKRQRAALKKKKPELPANLVGSLVALDVSSKAVGWAVFRDGEPTAYGCFRPEGPRDGGHGEKLASYEHWLLHLLSEENPDRLVIESPYVGRNPVTFGKLSMYYGVGLNVHHRFYGYELPPEQSLTPSVVKTILNASCEKLKYDQRKERMVCYMNDVYGFGLKYKANNGADDIADALAVGRAWLLKYGETAADAAAEAAAAAEDA
jgi:Holliday junction resolvasome RuvABC endonuclease subunit